MKIGIICAVQREAAPFLQLIKEPKTGTKAMLRFTEGKIADAEVVLVTCGVCKVNAAIGTQLLIDTYNVDAVINAGTAGGMDESLDILDTVIATEVAYHDVANEILIQDHPKMKDVFFRTDYQLLTAAHKVAEDASEPIFFGRMVTGECFIADEGRERINERFEPLSVDMETGAMAHVCYVNDTPFISIRCITDTAKHSGTGVFEENVVRAAAVAADITIKLIGEISGRESYENASCNNSNSKI